MTQANITRYIVIVRDLLRSAKAARGTDKALCDKDRITTGNEPARTVIRKTRGLYFYVYAPKLEDALPVETMPKKREPGRPCKDTSAE
jgi:hypothetical protein